MNKITNDELKTLRDHLLKKPFKYEEVFDEVLDHYASAYEQSELSLEEVISNQDHQFPNNKIEDINRRYYNDLRRHLRKDHFSIFLGNFRWPQLLTTLLLAVLFLALGPLVVQYKLLGIVLFSTFVIAPMFFGLFYYSKWGYRKLLGKTKLKNAHAEFFGVALGFILGYAQIPTFIRVFYNEDFKMLQHHWLLTAGILFLGMILFTTSMKMIFVKIRPAIS